MKILARISLLALALSTVHSVQAQSSRSTEAGVTRPRNDQPRVLSAPAERNVEDMRGAVKGAARGHIESSAHTATGGRLPVTSRDRSGGPLSSAAHDRGAVDFGAQRSRDLHADAKAIARAAGPGHKAIVEEPGRRRDTHTSYTVAPPATTIKSNTYTTPARATGPHIHVQPEYGIKRLPPQDDTSKYRTSGNR